MLVALILTCTAGFATILGGALALGRRASQPRALATALAFTAGAMVTISVLEIVPEAVDGAGVGWGVAWIGCGAALVVGGDVLTRVWRSRPRCAARARTEVSADGAGSRERLLRVGVLTAIAMIVHNTPEGFATFATALESPRLALPLVAAIALHNVPEGIAVAMPILHATGSRAWALGAATLAGLSEPVGALALWWVLGAAGLGAATSVMLGIVAGIMLAISALNLLPLAAGHLRAPALSGWCAAGAAVMALSIAALG